MEVTPSVIIFWRAWHTIVCNAAIIKERNQAITQIQAHKGDKTREKMEIAPSVMFFFLAGIARHLVQSSQKQRMPAITRSLFFILFKNDFGWQSIKICFGIKK
jgi:hypothetical protein